MWRYGVALGVSRKKLHAAWSTCVGGAGRASVNRPVAGVCIECDIGCSAV
jgi:hypothetical protein